MFPVRLRPFSGMDGLEVDIRNRAMLGDHVIVLGRTVRLVGIDFAHLKILGRHSYQTRRLRRVARILILDDHGGDDVRAHAAHEMNLGPRMLLLALRRVLNVDPTVEPGVSEPGGTLPGRQPPAGVRLPQDVLANHHKQRSQTDREQRDDGSSNDPRSIVVLPGFLFFRSAHDR